MQTTAVIILEYNNVKDTINCIQSVKDYNTAPVKFIVIDNGSTDGNIQRDLRISLSKLFPDSFTEFSCIDSIPSQLPDLTLYLNSHNEGYACGNNIGLNIAYNDPEIDNILILNNDILFVEDIIPELISNLTDNVAIVSPLLYKKGLQEVDTNCARVSLSSNQLITLHIPYPIDPFKIAKSRKLPVAPDNGLLEIELPSGSCMLAKKETFKEINGFDPNTFLYFEEDILWEKIRRTGRINLINTHLKCIHLGAVSTKKRASRFTVNTSFKSARYLLNTYRKPSLIQRKTMDLFGLLIDCRMIIVEKLKSIISKLS